MRALADAFDIAKSGIPPTTYFSLSVEPVCKVVAVTRTARLEKLVRAQAYGFDVHFGIRHGLGRAVVCRSTVGFLRNGSDLLAFAFCPPPHRGALPFPNRSHLFQKPPERELPLYGYRAHGARQEGAGHFKEFLQEC